jgi:hypothetical protein
MVHIQAGNPCPCLQLLSAHACILSVPVLLEDLHCQCPYFLLRCCFVSRVDLDDPDQVEAAQQALEAAAAQLHAPQTTPRYWTDFLQVGKAMHLGCICSRGCWTFLSFFEGH